jgi:hypothetical protein
MKLCLLLSGILLATNCFGTPAEDYRALTAGVDALRMGGSSGGVALQGRLSFPLGISTKREIVAAAGYYSDVATGGRVVSFAHTSFLEGAEADQKTLAGNVVRWAGRKAAPKVLVVGGSARAWKDAGFEAVSGELTAETLKGAEVVILNLHRNPFRDGPGALEAFAARGGGVVILTTPWAAPEAQLSAANAFLAKAGLALLGSGSSETAYPVTKEPPSPNWSAANAVEALLADKAGTAKLSAEEKQLSATTVGAVFAGGTPSPAVLASLEKLNASYGWIRFAKSPALRKANNPVEAMLARYQAHLLETWPAEKVPAHPSAVDFPGAVGEGAAVSRTVRFNAVSGPDKLINHGYKTLINTGVYARPGVPVTVTIPANAVNAGLKVELGIHIDRNWHLNAWRRAPQVTRKEELKQPVTKIANGFGGLVVIHVPENCQLGATQVTVTGAVEAPVFTLGTTTEADWNSRIKNAPGAWGYIETPKWIGYIPREILQKVENPEAVARYWQTVVDTADEYMGYAKWRRRGEAMLTDRDLVAGYGHAGYPVMMAYAHEDEGSRALVERGPLKGDWGFLHELGHTFQDSFDGNYTIATHAEVDVNLVPGIAMMLIHDRTAWDNNCHGTFDAKNRTKDMTAWDALPEADRTWDKACKTGSVAYDFYFTMAECFGWELYKKALGRMMDALQKPGSDADLAALDPKDPNFKRNRFFLCFSLSAQRNLLPHFERYGLGRGEHGLSPAVIEKVKALPTWSGNQPITSVAGPAKVRVKAGQPVGSALAQFTAKDPDAGTRFSFRIAGGNEFFAIEQRRGALTLAKAAPVGTYTLTIEADDSTIPRTMATTRCEVTVE